MNPTIPRYFISSFDNQEVSKEEKELYERFNDTFHKQDTVYSMIEVQNKYNLFDNPRNDYRTLKKYNDYISKILDLKIDCPTGTEENIRFYVKLKVISVLRTCYQHLKCYLASLKPDSTVQYILYH